MLIKINGSYRVSRGGSWDDYAFYCEVSYRNNFYPCHRYSYIGFRVLRRYDNVNKN